MRVNPNNVPDMLIAIQQSETSLQAALEQVSTGRRVNLPSDDPAAAASMVQNTFDAANVDQFTRNVTSTLSQVQVADSALGAVVSALTQAISLGTQAANGTNNSSNLQALAVQVQGIFSTVLSQANLSYQGHYLFSGTATSQIPYVADTSSSSGYTYRGNDGANLIPVGEKLNVKTNLPGSQIFSDPANNVLGAISALVSAIQSGDSSAIGDATTAITSAMNFVGQQRVVYGNAESQLNAQGAYLRQETVTLTAQANTLVGIDLAQAATKLSQAETDNNATLAAAAKVLPNTLLNYLSSPS